MAKKADAQARYLNAKDELEETKAQLEKAEAVIKMLERATIKYSEYFGAIRDGEYDKNRRPAPLRDYEEMMLNIGTEAAMESIGYFKEKGEGK